MYTTIFEKLAPKTISLHWCTRYINFCISRSEKNIKTPPEIVVKHHILPKHKKMFPEFSSLSSFTWNRAILTPREHIIAHFMLYKATNTYEEALSIMRSSSHMSNGKFVIAKLNSRLFDQGITKVIQTKRSLAIVKNKDGQIFTVKRNDDRIKSGELMGITSGKGVYVNVNTGVSKMLDVNSHEVISGEFVGYTKGKTIYKHYITGETLHLSVNDERVMSGEYVGINKNKPRAEKIKELHSQQMRGENNPMYGSTYVWVNNGITNKRCVLTEIEYHINTGWVKGFLQKLK